MNAEPFLEAARELRGRFYSLIDSLSALRGLTSIAIHHRPEKDLLEAALDNLLRNQDMERCSIFLLEEGKLRCAAGREWDEMFEGAAFSPARLTTSFPIGEGIMGEAALSGEILHCADCSRDPRFKPLGSTAEAPGGSLICSPIIAHDEVLGVVNVYHPEPGYFEGWHEHTLTLFCRVLGHMLENNRLLRRMECAVEDRTRQLEAALREAEQLKRRYEQLSNIDELTALHNRRFFFPAAEAVVAQAARYGHPFSLILVDVDRFKQINDRHGHAAGDMVLKDIATALKARTREVDIIARFGGEEFVVAMPSTEVRGACGLAERIRAAVSETRWSTDTGQLTATISVGVAHLGDRPAGTRDVLESMLREADRAMYEAKAMGRDRVVVFTDLPPGRRANGDGACR